MPQTRSQPSTTSKQGKATTAKREVAVKNGATASNKSNKRKKPAADAIPSKHRLKDLPVEIWCMIFDFATEWEEELDTSIASLRAMAALGYPKVHGQIQEGRLKSKKIAYSARLNIPLVCKNWKEAAPGHGKFRTLHIKHHTDLRKIMFEFLKWPRPIPQTDDEPIQIYSTPGKSVTRLELNYEVTQQSMEEIGSALRGLIRGCNNLTVVDDNTRRSGYERAPSPIEISLQAAVETPFSIALGNSQVHSIKYVHFSKDSLASFSLPWVIDLLKRFPNLEILSLADYPGWPKIPLVPNAKPDEVNGGQSSRRRRRHSRKDGSDDDSSDEHDSEADDEDEPLPILEFPKMHTLDISRLSTKDLKRSIALSKYLGQWTLPSVVNFSLSVYNHEAIPVVLLRQFSDNIQTMYLHHFVIPVPKPPLNPTPNNPVKKLADLLVDKKFDLPQLKHLLVVTRNVDNWHAVFTCPNVTHYTLTFRSYQPTPFDPKNPVCDFSKTWHSAWKKTTAHFNICRDDTILPHLEEIRLADYSFRSESIPYDHAKYWMEWEGRFRERDVAFVDCDGITWTAARVGMMSMEELKERDEKAKEEKEAAKVKEAEAAKAAAARDATPNDASA